MADTLKPEEKFYKSITTVKVKDRPIFKGSVQMLHNLGYDLSTLVGKSKEKESLRLYVEKDGLLKNLEGELKNLTLLESLTWDTLSNADKQVVLNLVKDIQELSGVNLGADHIQDNTKEVLSKCMEVVGKVSEQAKSLASIKSFSDDNLKGLLSQIDNGNIDYYHNPGEGILVPSKDDLDIVTALKMTGIDLEFNGTKWELKSASVEKGDVSFVPTKDGKPLQVFGNENIQFLLNNYLNVPQENRTQSVVPNKLLQVYVNEYERQMMEGKDPSSLEGGLVKQDVARQRKIFSMDSNEFQITKLLDRDTLMRNAQRAAMAMSFMEIGYNAKDTAEISDSIETVIDSMPNDPAYRNIVKGLNKLVPMLDNMGDKHEDAVEFSQYSLNYGAEYDRQIEYLEKTGAPDEHKDALKKAKAEYEATVVVQQSYWQAKLVELANANNGNIFSAGLAGAINESMGFAVMQNDGGEIVMANGETVQKFLEEKNLSADLYKELKARVQSKGSSVSNTETVVEQSATETAVSQTENDGQTVTKWPEIFFDYAANIAGMDFESEDNLVLDYSNMRLYQSMWQDGCFFDLDFKVFKQDNPDATIDNYITHFAKEKDVKNEFDPELVREAYCLVHPNEVEKAQLDKVQARIDAFNNHLLMTDLMLATFSLDDVSQYDDMPDSIRTPFLNKKYQEASKAFDELQKNPVGYQEALERAKKRHEMGVVGSVINQLWTDAAATADKEKGQGPLISKAVEAFLNSCATTQRKNNTELLKNGEPVIDSGEKTAENESGDTQKTDEPKKVTYGDIFPSGPNVNKFLKLMKPYSAKAVTKYFIEPLMVDIDKTKINMDAYYAKLEDASKVDYTNNVSSPITATKNQTATTTTTPNPEQNATMEEQSSEPSVKITQRDFEASTFMPGAIIFEEMAGNKEYFETTQNIAYTFKCLASTDKEMLMGNVVDGKDYRDALREYAIQVCGKEANPENNKNAVQHVDEILTKYGITDNEIAVRIRTGFLYMTPELLAYSFAPCSTLEDGKMTIGAKLPVKDLIDCENDAQRKKVIAEKCDMENSRTLLHELVGEKGIYRSQDGGMDATAINQGYSRSGESIPQMAELMRLRDAMKAQGMQVPKALEEVSTETAAEIENDGM